MKDGDAVNQPNVIQTSIEKVNRKPYLKPRLKTWGTVADLTQTGISVCGGDFQTYNACPDGGSVDH